MNDRMRFLLFRTLPLLALAGSLGGLLVACDAGKGPTSPPDGPPVQVDPTLGVVEVTISGLGTGTPTSSVLTARDVAALEQLRAAGTTSAIGGGPMLSLDPPANADASGAGTIQLEPVQVGSFTEGERGVDGVRHLFATYRIRNAQADGTPYDTPRENLTLLAVATDATLQQTAVSRLDRFDGSAADPTIATTMMPAGALIPGSNGAGTAPYADVLQVFTEAEVAVVPAPSGVTDVFPWGFVVRHANDPSSRTLPGSPSNGQFDGLVTFAFKMPLQATPADDPFSISLVFLAMDDSETRVTQSLEESGPEGSARVAARAQALGAGAVRVLPGATYDGPGVGVQPICSVRTAGPGGSPAAFLVNEEIASVDLAPLSDIQRPGVTPSLGLEVRNTGGDLVTMPVAWTVSNPELTSVDGMGTASARTIGLQSTTSTFTASACGQASEASTIRWTGYISLAAGANHVLAIGTDGTVSGWVNDNEGQATPPPGLADVVQVDASGAQHSIALRSDGTVAVWGKDDSDGQEPPPGDLADVVQVSLGWAHGLSLHADGTVTAWGRDFDGQATVPGGLSNVVQVEAGNNFSLALLADSTVVAWGNNDFGQTSLPPLAGVVQLSATGLGALALLSDGTLVGWGHETASHLTPPGGLENVVQVAASTDGHHALALLDDGTVTGWGSETAGANSPPDGLANVVKVAAGGARSFALLSDGTVVSWGSTSGTVPQPFNFRALVP